LKEGKGQAKSESKRRAKPKALSISSTRENYQKVQQDKASWEFCLGELGMDWVTETTSEKNA
jgi:hypothetical protein